ncbi:hypothetical protein AB0I06_08660 [Streptomyces sp. NPDC050674]|uniref:hypothetical protein n=1 Tax=Streptomyces sp. NPDC050674 TaxID=3157216 RepID=UPI00341248C2
MGLNTQVNEAQEQAFKENAADFAQLESQLDEVRRRALSRLESVGLTGGTDILNCLVCTVCQGWTPGDDNKCGNCSHDWFAHNVK